MPVSWQMAPSPSAARSMFCAMIVSACAGRVPAGSAPCATFIAARTSGGRSVEVLTMSWSTLSKNEGSMRESIIPASDVPSSLEIAVTIPDRTRSARRAARSPPTRTTASRRRAPSRTSRISGLRAPRRSRHRHRSSSRRPPPRPTRRSAGSTPTSARAIVAAADEILAGALRDQFVVDVYQAGAGTSHNMNANEVLANRAAELLGERARRLRRACTRTITSTWASRPTTCSRRRRGSRCCSAAGALVAAARALADGARRARPTSSRDVLKIGRTHLQDAVPMTLGQEFGGYAACIDRGADDVERGVGAAAGAEPRRDGGRHRPERRRRLPPPRRRRICARYTGLPLVPAANLFRVTQSMGDVLALLRARCGASRSSSARSRATCGCSAWGRARASPRSRCPPCSRDRRSCRAR